MVNIVICGTPGTGKSTLIEKLKPQMSDVQFVNISKFAIDENCITDFDAELHSHVIDEEKLALKLGPHLKKSNHNIIETIHPDYLERDQVDYVFVCRTDNSILYDRLDSRGYESSKLSNNIEAEIFQTVLDEARDFFDTSIVREIVNNDASDLTSNVKLVREQIDQLKA